MTISSNKLFLLLSKIIFGLYICLLIWTIVFKCNLIDSVGQTYTFFKNFSLNERFHFDLVPFKDYIEGPFLSQIDTIIEDDILNILFFIPFGMYLALFTKKMRFVKVFVASLILSTLFELIQLFSLIGSFSTKDIITNTIGGVIGYLICILVYKKENSIKKIKLLNILSIIVILILLPIVIYSIFNTIKYFKVYLEIIQRTYVY